MDFILATVERPDMTYVLALTNIFVIWIPICTHMASGFRSATHMSYPERSWVKLAYLYLHDSLPETAGNTVTCSVFLAYSKTSFGL